MIVAIHQPNYLPGLGFFRKMARADCFVLLDQVQYSKNNFTNRNRIRCGDGWSWLTVPVVSSGHFGQSILEVETVGDGWEQKHWKRLTQEYGQARHFDRYAAALHSLYARRWQRLAEMNGELIEFVRRALGFKTVLVKASELGVRGNGSDLLLAICRKLGASTYLSGQGGKKYLEAAQFEAAGIAVSYQEFAPPHYEQGGAAFTPNLSVVDLLFHAGSGSRDLLCAAGSIHHAERAL